MTGPHLGIFDRSEVVDRALGSRCSQLLSYLRASSDAELIEALADPRDLHRALYRGLAPESDEDLAGHFRGADHPALKNRMVYFSFNDTEGTTNIAAPHEVTPLMDQYAGLLRVHGLRPTRTVEEKLAMVAPLMVMFGLIHPFPDGNGHVQRITVQCLIERPGFEMAAAWRVHPCPYGEEVHRALAAADLAKVAGLLRRFVA